MKIPLGHTNKEIIEVQEANNLQELARIILSFAEIAGREQDTIYLEDGNGEHVTLRLIENTLTDGSKTYDVRMS